MAELERRLGHRFRDLALLERALTHASYANEHPSTRDHEPLATQQAVDETRFSHVGPTHDRDVDRLVVLAHAGRRQQRHHLVQQVAARLPHRRRHGERVAQPELVEGEVARVVGEAVRLVRDQQHRPLRPSQVLSDLEVGGVDPLLHVHEEEQ